MNVLINKRIEIYFRKFLIALLGKIFHRNKPLPPLIDINNCKFLFIRQDRIGDVLISTPIYTLLKKTYPNAIIDFLLSQNNYFVLENDPLIRKRWIYEKKIASIISLTRNIRKERYDFAIDLMDNPSTTSTLLCLLLKAKWNIGIEKDNSFIYDIRVPMLSRKETHIVCRIAQLLTPFRIDPSKEKIAIHYYVSQESEEYAKEFLENNKVIDYPLIGVNISSGNKARFWGIENFRSLLIHIKDKYPSYKILLLYMPSNKNEAYDICKVGPNEILSPITSTFDQFAAFIKRLSFLITPDTSAVHLASAFRINSVVLYVQSDKNLRIWEPLGNDYEALITDVDNLKSIEPAEVFVAFSKLYKRQNSIRKNV